VRIMGSIMKDMAQVRTHTGKAVPSNPAAT
jgi:hypothetical protein